MRLFGNWIAKLAMAMASCLLWVTLIRSDECTPNWLAVSSLRMAILLPPAVMCSSLAANSI